MIDTQTFFDRCYCINLARRPDRWQKVVDEIMPEWPFRPLERYNAIDGDKCEPPQWWRIAPGAWGGYKSHLNLVEQCLNEGCKSVLIIEDDVILHPDIAEEAAKFLEDLPSDWDMAYLGGRMLETKIDKDRVTDNVWRAIRVMLTHAVAYSEQGLHKAYEWFQRANWNRMHAVGQYVDYQLFKHHQTNNIFVPKQWLMIQSFDQSDVYKGPRHG